VVKQQVFRGIKILTMLCVMLSDCVYWG
jgi:hypothetical protein